MTQHEKILNMTLEEFAEFLSEGSFGDGYCYPCSIDRPEGVKSGDCLHCITKWLNSEVKVGNADGGVK